MNTSDWAPLARKHLAPSLPGSWVVRSNNVTRLPTRHLAWVVSFQPRHGGFFLDALALPMFVYSEVLAVDVTNRHLGGPQPRGHFFDFDAAARIVADPEHEFPALVHLVLDEALPHWARTAGSVSAYRDQLRTFAAGRPSGRGTAHTEHATAAACLLLGDLDSARAAYQKVLAEALPLGRPHSAWLAQLVRTAEQRLDLDDTALSSVADELLAVEDRMRERWKLPPPEHPSPKAGLR